jgi:hypothetical protein
MTRVTTPARTIALALSVAVASICLAFQGATFGLDSAAGGKAKTPVVTVDGGSLNGGSLNGGSLNGGSLNGGSLNGGSLN